MLTIVLVGRRAASNVTTCDAGSGSCPAAKVPNPSVEDFWVDIRRRMQIKLARAEIDDKGLDGLPKGNRTGMLLTDDVFYGRAIMKIPRSALISIETTRNLDLKRELNRYLFEEERLAKDYNITLEDSSHLLSLAYPLIIEERDPNSPFREWLDAVRNTTLLALRLTERQKRVLEGTTIEGAAEEMEKQRDFIQHTASNLTFFRNAPVTQAQASWSLAVILRHSRIVHPHQDVRESRQPRMYLFPLVELLGVQLHPDPGVAIPFQEEMTLDGKKEEEMVLQIARRDMPKGDEVFLWAGRLSNSDMALRHGLVWPRNPIGVGRNISAPPNWSDKPDSNVRKEYDAYNCSSLEEFELRFSINGFPMRNFVRCYRVSWFLVNGWYTPALQKRMRELNKWPPPKKYSKDDWLAWTQADAEVNRVILTYCRDMRLRLKETMDSPTAEDFRNSKDPVDKLLWQVRSEESKTFKNCIAVAKTVLETS